MASSTTEDKMKFVSGHLAKFLSRNVPGLTLRPADLNMGCAFLRSLKGIVDLDRAGHPRAVATKANESNVPLLRLPFEMLGDILDLVSPADVLAVTFSCRSLYGQLGYQLSALCMNCPQGIQTHDYTRAADVLMREQTAASSWIVQNARERLIGAEESGRSGHLLLFCTACVEQHPRRFFSAEQALQDPRVRRCLASQARLLLCPHRSYDSVQCRALVAGSDPPSLRIDLGPCQRCEQENPQMPLDTRVLVSRTLCGLHLRQEYTARAADATRTTLGEAIDAFLQQISHVDICAHVQLDHGTLRALLLSEPYKFHNFNCNVSGCVTDCSLRVTSVLRKTLKLEFTWMATRPNNIWHPKYLQHVENGTELVRLSEQ